MINNHLRNNKLELSGELNEGCPLCSSLISLVQLCPQCHRALIDGGRVEDYLSPDDPDAEIEEGRMENQNQTTCTHLIYCPNCGQDWKVNIDP